MSSSRLPLPPHTRAATLAHLHSLIAPLAPPAPPKSHTALSLAHPALQPLFPHGLPRGHLVECIAPHAGASFLLTTLLASQALERRLTALVDGADSFDPLNVEPSTRAHLLWLRCHSAQEALKTCDLLTRDGNLPLILLDLKSNPPRQLRAIPSSTWFRLKRALESASSTLLAFTPFRFVGPAALRLEIHHHWRLDDIETPRPALWNQFLASHPFHLEQRPAALAALCSP